MSSFIYCTKNEILQGFVMGRKQCQWKISQLWDWLKKEKSAHAQGFRLLARKVVQCTLKGWWSVNNACKISGFHWDSLETLLKILSQEMRNNS